MLALAAIRLLWRLGHAAPAYPAQMSLWQQRAASALHVVLYVLMFAIPVSGYLYTLSAGIPVVYLGLFQLPVLIDANPELKPLLKLIHYWLNMGLLACVSVHVLAALKHHFIDRDSVLKRILP